MIKHGLPFHRTSGAINLTRCVSPKTQSSLFRSAAQQQVQAGLSPPPEPEYVPAHIVQDLLETVSHQAVAPKIFAQDLDGPMKHSGASTAQEVPLPVAETTTGPTTKFAAVPAYFRDVKFDPVPYWQKIGRWKDITEKQFLSYRWGTANDIQGKMKLHDFLKETLPEKLPQSDEYENIRTRDDFIKDVMDGIDRAPMSIRISPHIISSIDWANPLEDPLRRQFIPMMSTFQKDHPVLTLDPQHETEDSPVQGLVHRYNDKCLFLAASHCPLYCRFCTRSYAVGANTSTVTKSSLKPQLPRWEAMLQYIASNPVINDVVISGGDSYSLMPHHLRLLGDRLLAIPHIRRFRIATKGLCVSPSRTLDPEDDWTDELIALVKRGRECGKHIALHTHFNHPSEFSWVSREAAQKLFANGVIVRNQSVLLKGVNDSVETMGALIRELADNNIQPYYVYAGDLVRGVEDLRTPLSTILTLEEQLRGTIAGFMTPQFVVDLPGGGGKRLAASYKTYDRKTGKSTFVAPAIKGGETVYEYWDPLASLPAQ